MTDEVAGDRHGGPLVGDFASLGDDLADDTGGVEEDPGFRAEVEGSHFAV